MRLLIDSVPVRSGGLLQLRDELSDAVARHAPAGSTVTLLAAPNPPATLQSTETLKIVTHRKPRWGWLGSWWWHNRMLPRLARRQKADVVYSLSGILMGTAVSEMGAVTSINNMVPFSPKETAQFPLWSQERLRHQRSGATRRTA